MVVQEMARKARDRVRREIATALPVIIGDRRQDRRRSWSTCCPTRSSSPRPAASQPKVERRGRGGVILRDRRYRHRHDPEQIPIALAPFGQIDSGLNRKYDGVGLGLPLTKRLIELHGGTIEIASSPGKGTAVTVYICRKAVSSAKRGARPN